MSDDFYAQDTASTSRGDGVRDLVMTDRWQTPLGTPNGGYILAAMLRGLADEHDLSRPMVASISYLTPPATGAATIESSVLKRGRRVQTAEGTLVQAGRPVAHLVASFGERGDGESRELGSAPALPAPDDCLDPMALAPEGTPLPSLFSRVEYRVAQVPGWMTGTPSGDPTAEIWQRMAGGRDVDFPALAFLVDSYAPPVLELGLAGAMTVQLTVHLHRLPVSPWVASRFTTRHVVEGYCEEDCELWDEDGTLLAQGRQLSIVAGGR